MTHDDPWRIGRRALLATALAAAAPAALRAQGAGHAFPSVAFRVAAGFRRLPDLDFPIEDLTFARRSIWVEPGPGSRVRRAVIVQLETVRPGSSFRFRYPPRPPATFGSRTYRFGAYVYDDEREAAMQRTKEAGLTRGWLSKNGFHPPRLWRVARLARVADPGGLSEVILFYLENADDAFPAGPLAGADEDGDLPLGESDGLALLGRMRGTVFVERD